MITPVEALNRCIEHREIFHDEMLHLMRMLMRGEMSPTIAAALLMGLRVKKETVGEITSGALSPTLGYPIAMALVHPAHSAVGTELAIDVRGTQIPATVVALPFYKRS